MKTMMKWAAFLSLLALTAVFAAAQVPDIGGRIAFVSDRGGIENIWVLDIKTSECRKITDFPGAWGFTSLEQPQWSLDGKRILFSGYSGGQWLLCVMNEDGSGIRQLSPAGQTVYFRWDPVDSDIVYYNFNNAQFHRLRLSTGADEALPNPAGTSNPETFDISNDGGEILATRQSTYQFQGLSAPVSLRTIKAYEGRRSYSNRINRIDGWICYWESLTDPCMSWDTNIFKISPDGLVRVQLTFGIAGQEHFEMPSWAGGGNEDYVFFSGNHFGDNEIMMLKADGVSYPQGLINLTNHPASDREPDWTPTSWNAAPAAVGREIRKAAGADCRASAAASEFDGGSTDPDGDALTFSVSPAGPYPMGETEVLLTVTDEHGAFSTAPARIIVFDAAPPQFLSLTATPDVLPGHNHKMYAVSVSAEVVDTCGSPASVRVVEVTSNEPVNGPGDGNTEIDWEITGAMTLNLRGERSGTGDGRIYTIKVEAKDRYGNISFSTTTVVVPFN